jgi:uncharacterized protein (UPF0264 family)
MVQLLVSVRGAAEAEAALRGGAGLVDVKEPANGPLGKAADAVIAEVVRAVAGRVPVSAALGEWLPSGVRRPVSGLAYVKTGLAGSGREDWRKVIGYIKSRTRTHYHGATPVPVAYADWQQADAPPVDAVCAYAREQANGVFLLDTYGKGAGQNLLDRLPLRKLALLCKLCRAAGVKTALAGSLGPGEIRKLLPLRPDWIAVRGAACEGGRDGTVSEEKVRELAALVSRPPRES